MAEASDFKFGILLGFAKAHHKITPWGKSRGGLGQGELLKILGFPSNISATAGASDFKFGMHLEFAKAHHNTTPRGKVGVALGYGSSQIFGVSLKFLCNSRAVLLALAELLVEHIVRIHLNTYPICKQVSECRLPKSMLVAVQATYSTAECKSIFDTNFCWPSILNLEVILENETGFTAERVTGNSYWCLTLGMWWKNASG